MSNFSKISVIGLGYIGLPTAAIFASRKIKVVGVDVNEDTVDTINRGDIHIIEPDLDMVVHAAVTEGFLCATTSPESADAFLIAVPTPFQGTNHDPDLGFIESAAKAIAPVLKKNDLVILESTSPVGTTEMLAGWLAQARPDLTFPDTHGETSDIRIAHCPERVLPGKVMQELILNDRVIGGLTKKCSDLAVELYKVFLQGDCVVTDARTAEMAKLTENSFRDVNIAFANELSIICDKLDIDVWELISLANRHPRVNVLQPGPGVGGHCIAVDPWFIVSKTPEEAQLIRCARNVNDKKPEWVLEKINNAVQGFSAQTGKNPDEIAVAFFGLAFKPNIDDLRGSPSVEIVRKFSALHPGKILVVEPHVSQLPEAIQNLEHIGAQTAINTADIMVLLVQHDAFRNLDFPASYLKIVG